jgi:ketosteroid isomerase-like protein
LQGGPPLVWTDGVRPDYPIRELALPSSDIAAIRATEKALAEAFESPDPAAWVDFYTEDAIFVGPGAPAIEGRSTFLEVAPEVGMSSVEIVAESILGTGDFAASLGRAS